jgi:hypothetical protein
MLPLIEISASRLWVAIGAGGFGITYYELMLFPAVIVLVVGLKTKRKNVKVIAYCISIGLFATLCVVHLSRTVKLNY